jgi:hypothetical protein
MNAIIVRKNLSICNKQNVQTNRLVYLQKFKCAKFEPTGKISNLIYNDNWKTEETLVGAVVTLETERIKGSNP